MIEALGENVWAVHADVKTLIHLKKDVAIDDEKVLAVLKKQKVKHGAIERDDKYIL